MDGSAGARSCRHHVERRSGSGRTVAFLDGLIDPKRVGKRRARGIWTEVVAYNEHGQHGLRFRESVDPIRPELRTRGHRGLPCWLRPRQRAWPLRIETWQLFPSCLAGCAQGSCLGRIRSHGAFWPWRSVSSGWRVHLGGDRPPNTPDLDVGSISLSKKSPRSGQHAAPSEADQRRPGGPNTSREACSVGLDFAGARHDRSAHACGRSTDSVMLRSLAENDDVSTMYGSGSAILRLGRAEKPREQA